MQEVDSTKNDFHLAKVKHMKDGCILIGCETKEENDKLKEQTQKRNYEILEVAGINPKW